jgi:hypothetical protein
VLLILLSYLVLRLLSVLGFRTSHLIFSIWKTRNAACFHKILPQDPSNVIFLILAENLLGFIFTRKDCVAGWLLRCSDGDGDRVQWFSGLRMVKKVLCFCHGC